jgi:D-glycero-alpha-D-manno-heptose-7-phosphate kinase
VISNELSKFSKEKYRFTYRVTESVENVKKFNHPVVREALKIFNEVKSINISTMADLPGKTGLGSSSAFSVALIQNLSMMLQKKYSPIQIAQIAIKIERKIIKEPGGIQDQLHSSIGGLRFYTIMRNEINFGDDFSTTNFGRKLNKSNRMTKKQYDYLTEINNISNNFKNEFSPDSSSLNLLIDSVNESWDIKSKIDVTSSSKEIERLTRLGFENGALAAKLCGAGKSGFVLFICDPASRLDLIKLFGKDKCETFEFTKSGSLSRYFH